MSGGRQCADGFIFGCTAKGEERRGRAKEKRGR